MKSKNAKKKPAELPDNEAWYLEPTSSNLNAEITDPDYGDQNAMAHIVTCRLKDGSVVDRTVFKITRHLAEIIYTKRHEYNFVLYGAKLEGMMPKEAVQNLPKLFNPYDRKAPKVIKGSSLLRKEERHKKKKRAFKGVH